MTSSPSLAGPPGKCCVQGFKHTGTPGGTFETVDGVNTYVARPPTTAEKYEHIILYFSDIWSPLHLNNQLVMDQFASNGYLVLAPDCFDGDPVFPHLERDPNFDIPSWITPKREHADIIIPPWIEAAKEKFGATNAKYAAVGYCFGAPDVMRLCAGDFVKACAIVHPVFLNESHFSNAKQPVFLSVCDDHAFPRDARHRAEDLLTEAGAVHHVQAFVGFPHGFAARGNPDVPIQRWAKEACTNGIVGWFDQFVKNDASFIPFEKDVYF